MSTNDFMMATVKVSRVTYTFTQTSTTNTIPDLPTADIPAMGIAGWDFVNEQEGSSRSGFSGDLIGVDGTNSRTVSITNFIHGVIGNYTWTNGFFAWGNLVQKNYDGTNWLNPEYWETNVYEFVDSGYTNTLTTIGCTIFEDADETNAWDDVVYRLNLYETWAVDVHNALLERRMALCPEERRAIYRTFWPTVYHRMEADGPWFALDEDFNIYQNNPMVDLTREKLFLKYILIPVAYSDNPFVNQSGTIGEDAGLYYTYHRWIDYSQVTNGTLNTYWGTTNTWPWLTAQRACELAGAPTNYLEYTPEHIWPGGGGKAYGRVVTSQFEIATSDTGMVTNTVITYHGTTNEISGTNGQVVAIVTTNENILAGYDENDYTWKYMPAIIDQLRAVGSVATISAPVARRGFGSATNDWASAIADALANTDPSTANASGEYTWGRKDAEDWYASFVSEPVNVAWEQAPGTVFVSGQSKVDAYVQSQTPTVQASQDTVYTNNTTGLIEGQYAYVGTGGFMSTNSVTVVVGSTNTPAWANDPADYPPNYKSEMGWQYQASRIVIWLNSTNAFKYWQNEPSQ